VETVHKSGRQLTYTDPSGIYRYTRLSGNTDWTDRDLGNVLGFVTGWNRHVTWVMCWGL